MIDTIEARRARIRDQAEVPSDLAWLRAIRRTCTGECRSEGLNVSVHYVCDCRCSCHGEAGGAPTATGAVSGSCGLMIDPDTLDCGRNCRAAHILASECRLDQMREGAHV